MLLSLLLGILLQWRQHDPDKRWRGTLLATAAGLLFATGAWLDFSFLEVHLAHDGGALVSRLLGAEWLVIDELSSPLIPLGALIHFLVVLMTPSTERRRFTFKGLLLSEVLLLLLLVCREPWVIILFLLLATVPPFLDLRSRGRSTRNFVLHSGLFGLLLVAGWALLPADSQRAGTSVGMVLLILALLVRSGSIPVHCWMTDLFENASFGMSLLYVTPMAGAYAAVRLVLPQASASLLHLLGFVSLVTAVYAAGMALVQKEARRFYCYLFLSLASLVLVGLEVASPLGLAGALCVWLSVAISMAGFGLTLRAVECRTGRISLSDYHGLYDHMPTLAVFFLLTGLACIGFPGSVGFIGAELLVEGVMSAYPHVGFLVILAGALNGIAVMSAYFKLFTGDVHTATISLGARPTERLAVWILSVLILGGGLFPQRGVESRYKAASEILSQRPNTPSSSHSPHLEGDIAQEPIHP
jgi:NADH-quinone oxidoreductase subunit M